jgi:hypothetical protein
MDFSLLQTHSRKYLLRDIVALKARWFYYFIIVVDPILRFAWIFYAIFTRNSQHSTIVTFLVSLAEVTRRGMWALIRVENEHCANVAQYKASRDIPLPYHIEPLPGDRPGIEASPLVSGPQDDETESAEHAAGAQVEEETAGTPSPAVGEASGTVRRRPHGRSFSRMLAEAHKQDFEKKRKPVDGEGREQEEDGQTDDEDMEGDEDVEDSMSLMEVGEAESFFERGKGRGTGDGEETGR